METMKVATYQRFGSAEVVEISTMAKPIANDTEVLVKLTASTVSSADSRLRGKDFPRGFGFLASLFFGFKKPRKKILGGELSGIVEAVGKNVTRFKEKDEVFAYPGAMLGCHAEYRVMPENGPIALRPKNIPLPHCSALSFAGVTAWCFLHEMGKVQPKEEVLVVGATGAVGSAAVQLAKYLGASVTGVCSGSNKKKLLSLKADKVIDYEKQTLKDLTHKYDVVMETVDKTDLSTLRGLLKPGGRLLLVVADLPKTLHALSLKMVGRLDVKMGDTKATIKYLEQLKKMVEEGKYKPLIGKEYPFKSIRKAYVVADSGHKVGNTIIHF